MSLEIDQCNYIKEAYNKLLKTDKPQIKILLDLVMLQFQCVREFIDKGDKKVFCLEHQMELERKIIKLLKNSLQDLFQKDVDSTKAVVVLFNRFSKMLLEDKDILKADYAESIAYYLHKVIGDDDITPLLNKEFILGAKAKPKNKIGDDNVKKITSLDEVMTLYTTLKDALDEYEKFKSEGKTHEMNKTVKNALSRLGELLYDKMTDPTQKFSDDTIRRLEELVGTRVAEILENFRNLDVHSQDFLDIKLGNKRASELYKELLVPLEKASAVIANQDKSSLLDTKKITAFARHRV